MVFHGPPDNEVIKIVWFSGFLVGFLLISMVLYGPPDNQVIMIILAFMVLG